MAHHMYGVATLEFTTESLDAFHVPAESAPAAPLRPWPQRIHVRIVFFFTPPAAAAAPLLPWLCCLAVAGASSADIPRNAATRMCHVNGIWEYFRVRRRTVRRPA